MIDDMYNSKLIIFVHELNERSSFRFGKDNTVQVTLYVLIESTNYSWYCIDKDVIH